jgi:acetone carboxylase gamma subunit
MATASSTDDLMDQFLAQRGHDVEDTGWNREYNKKQCPDCGGLHDTAAAECTVCGWSPV